MKNENNKEIQIYKNGETKTVTINSLEFNHKKSLFIIATNLGYRVYETNSFKVVSNVGIVQEAIIGDIAQASLLSSSAIVIFRGQGSNPSFCSNQLCLWNDFLRRKEGLIILKEPINMHRVTKSLIFIMLKEQLLLFDLYSFSFIKNISVANNTCKVTSGFLQDILCYIGSDFSNVITITRFKRSEKRKLYCKSEMLKSNFKEVSSIKCIDETLIVVSGYGNKIHLYDSETLQLNQCIFLGYVQGRPKCFSFTQDKKYFVFFFSKKSAANEIKAYDLSKANKDNYLCFCFKHKDAEMKKKRMFTIKNGFLSKLLFSGIQTKEVAQLELKEYFKPISGEFIKKKIYYLFTAEEIKEYKVKKSKKIINFIQENKYINS